MKSIAALAAALIAGVPAAHADTLSGIWKVVVPVTELRTIDGGRPPLRPAAAKLYRQRSAQRARGDLDYDPTRKCRPIGEPRGMYEGQPFEIVQTPDILVFSYQWNRLDHILYADTTAALGVPTFFGSGPFLWDGRTLELRLSMFHADTLLDAAGMPHSAELKLVERFTLSPDHKMLTETIMFDDPKTFTHPWSAIFRYKRQEQVRLDEDVCEERMKLFARTARPE